MCKASTLISNKESSEVVEGRGRSNEIIEGRESRTKYIKVEKVERGVIQVNCIT